MFIFNFEIFVFCARVRGDSADWPILDFFLLFIYCWVLKYITKKWLLRRKERQLKMVYLKQYCPIFSFHLLKEWSDPNQCKNFTLHTVHCTLYTTHFTQHQCTLYTAHTTLNNVHCTLQTIPYTLHTQHWTLHTAQCTLHTAHWTLHTTHWTWHTAYCILHTYMSHFPLLDFHLVHHSMLPEGKDFLHTNLKFCQKFIIYVVSFRFDQYYKL